MAEVAGGVDGEGITGVGGTVAMVAAMVAAMAVAICVRPVAAVEGAAAEAAMMDSVRSGQEDVEGVVARGLVRVQGLAPQRRLPLPLPQLQLL